MWRESHMSKQINHSDEEEVQIAIKNQTANYLIERFEGINGDDLNAVSLQG